MNAAATEEFRHWRIERDAHGTAWLTLTHHQVLDAGDHEFALCNVVTMDAPDEPVEPVIFYGGAYRSLAALEDD